MFLFFLRITALLFPSFLLILPYVNMSLFSALLLSILFNVFHPRFRQRMCMAILSSRNYFFGFSFPQMIFFTWIFRVKWPLIFLFFSISIIPCLSTLPNDLKAAGLQRVRGAFLLPAVFLPVLQPAWASGSNHSIWLCYELFQGFDRICF